MRVMVLVKATEDSEKGVMPPGELLEAMGKYNEELIKAGTMTEQAAEIHDRNRDAMDKR